MKNFKHIIAVALTTTALSIAPAIAAQNDNETGAKVEAGTEMKTETKTEGQVAVKPGKETIKLEETQEADQEPTKHMKEVTDGDKSAAAKDSKMAKTDSDAATDGKVKVKPGEETM